MAPGSKQNKQSYTLVNWIALGSLLLQFFRINIEGLGTTIMKLNQKSDANKHRSREGQYHDTSTHSGTDINLHQIFQYH